MVVKCLLSTGGVSATTERDYTKENQNCWNSGMLNDQLLGLNDDRKDLVRRKDFVADDAPLVARGHASEVGRIPHLRNKTPSLPC